MPNTGLIENNFLHNSFESSSSYGGFEADSWSALSFRHKPSFEEIMAAALATTEKAAKEVEAKNRANEMERSFVFINDYISIEDSPYTDPIAEKGFMDKIMDILSSIGDFFQEIGKLFFTVS